MCTANKEITEAGAVLQWHTWLVSSGGLAGLVHTSGGDSRGRGSKGSGGRTRLLPDVDDT